MPISALRMRACRHPISDLGTLGSVDGKAIEKETFSKASGAGVR